MRRLGAAALAGLVLVGCELQEVSIVDVQDVLVAEVYVNLAADPADNEIISLVHRTLNGNFDDPDLFADLLATEIVVTRGDGLSIPVTQQQFDRCVETAPFGDPGLCFAADPSDTPALQPGDLLEVRLDFPDGRSLVGATRLPGDFELDATPTSCRLPPDELMRVSWSTAEGAWAYVNETSIRGLPAALQREGIVVDEDPLYLLGLSISDEDTSIVFPAEFGIFNRFDLDQDVALRLQRGLPEGVSAEVTITAVDRNYVNWARGGSFNPSGQVRVPSLSGQGTGVFGSTVGRRFTVASSSDEGIALEVCPLG